MLEIKTIKIDTPEYKEMVALRNCILRTPLGMSLSAEELETDKQSFLLGGFEGEELCACIVLDKRDPDWIKIEQLAVGENQQRKGLGMKMLEAAYSLAKDLGYKKVFCHARETAMNFYLKDDWSVVGDVFFEQDLPHYRMEKFL